MSRIGKLPIPIPEKAKVSIEGQTVSVEGPKGSLKKSFDNSVKIELVENVVQVAPTSDSRHARAMFGTARSIINGMVVGVVDGYTKKLEIKEAKEEALKSSREEDNKEGGEEDLVDKSNN